MYTDCWMRHHDCQCSQPLLFICISTTATGKALQPGLTPRSQHVTLPQPDSPLVSQIEALAGFPATPGLCFPSRNNVRKIRVPLSSPLNQRSGGPESPVMKCHSV